ncbi:FliM/FliN family flagellar motor switch protein [Thalassobius sp. MITS945101]|uniref:FliM/FliN family flagellar motor switch protein n=1 Tax=Thalassobius sp. MITS945101 TaxID=3096994 RepID=UPI00399B27F2
MTDTPQFSSVPIEVLVSVGRARPKIGELMALTEESVLPLDRSIDDPVELYIGERLIARGQLEEAAEGEGAGLVVRLTQVATGGEGLL